MQELREVLRYVKETKDHGITYKHNGGNKIHGYSDSSYGVNTQEGKGTTGLIFYYGESPVSWSTQKQATVALSSCELEFIAATAAATQDDLVETVYMKPPEGYFSLGDEIICDNKITTSLVGVILSDNGDGYNNHGDDGFGDVEGAVTEKAPHDVDTSCARESKPIVTEVSPTQKNSGSCF
uniref:Ribonuclease H-like domain, reverse transcriptase, RNA-dependent DNA polymerase n=1 Tax=Tanacetum cinerariifolium TaxID=118510 RepID=A0A6L2KSC3_TANCI|nr:ribonuclease H-like domain, reverse transcriptase, RNA-dependent DNA polymerase [Tanacetum cinerariifolium]